MTATSVSNSPTDVITVSEVELEEARKCVAEIKGYLSTEEEDTQKLNDQHQQEQSAVVCDPQAHESTKKSNEKHPNSGGEPPPAEAPQSNMDEAKKQVDANTQENNTVPQSPNRSMEAKYDLLLSKYAQMERTLEELTSQLAAKQRAEQYQQYQNRFGGGSSSPPASPLLGASPFGSNAALLPERHLAHNSQTLVVVRGAGTTAKGASQQLLATPQKQSGQRQSRSMERSAGSSGHKVNRHRSTSGGSKGGDGVIHRHGGMHFANWQPEDVEHPLIHEQHTSTSRHRQHPVGESPGTEEQRQGNNTSSAQQRSSSGPHYLTSTATVRSHSASSIGIRATTTTSHALAPPWQTGGGMHFRNPQPTQKQLSTRRSTSVTSTPSAANVSLLQPSHQQLSSICRTATQPESRITTTTGTTAQQRPKTPLPLKQLPLTTTSGMIPLRNDLAMPLIKGAPLRVVAGFGNTITMAPNQAPPLNRPYRVWNNDAAAAQREQQQQSAAALDRRSRSRSPSAMASPNPPPRASTAAVGGKQPLRSKSPSNPGLKSTPFVATSIIARSTGTTSKIRNALAQFKTVLPGEDLTHERLNSHTPSAASGKVPAPEARTRFSQGKRVKIPRAAVNAEKK